MKSFISLFLFLFILSNTLFAKEHKNILILSSYHQTLPWSESYVNGVKQYINEQDTYDIDLYQEYMENIRLNYNFDEKLWLNYLKNKYKTIKINALLVDSTFVTEFQYKHAEALFGNIPIVMFTNKNQNTHRGENYFFYETQMSDAIENTLALATKQLPNSNKIVVIANLEKSSLALLQLIKEKTKKYKNHKMIPLLDLSLDEYKKEISKLDKNTILIFTILTKDKQGNPLIPKDVVTEFSKVSNTPIYTLYSTMINTGTLGGHVIDANTVGYNMAKSALFYIKDGVFPQYYETNKTVFDYEIIKKFNIKENTIPIDAQLINKEATFFEIYKKEIIIFTICMLLIILLLVYLYITNLRLTNSKEKVKNKNLELTHEKLLLQTIINSVPIRIFWKNSDGVYLGANQLFLNDAGLKIESEIIGKNDYEMVWINEAQAYRADDKEVMDSNKAKLHILEEQTQKDKKIVVDTSKVPLHGSKGEVIGILGVYQDITEQINLSKQLEELNKNLEQRIEEKTKELQSQKDIFEELFENTTDGLFLMQDGKIIGCNNTLIKMLGLKSKKEYINSLPSFTSAAIQPDGTPSNEKALKLFNECIRTGHVESEWLAKRSNGEVFWTNIAANKIKLHGKDTAYARLRDIDKIKKLQLENEEQTKEIIKEKDKAQEATRAKSYFLANMSHEIRTPMNGIIGMSHLVLETNLDKQQKHYINRINSSAHALLGIINDILDISKIESGKLQIEKINFDLFEIIENVINLIEVKAEEKGLDLIVDYDVNLGKEHYGDNLRINQILTNLLSNAVKFTSKGRIKIKVTQLENDFVRFEVSDTGIGLNKEQMSKIFDSFTQADETTTKKYGGTGLGLTITKNLLELMNGKIWVESELGIGSNFIFEIELRKATKSKPYTVFNRKKALIIDDNDTWLNIITQQLKSFGLESKALRNGAEAINILKAKNNFDIILIDWDMPDFDGIEISKILINDLHINSEKIVLVSAHNKDTLVDLMKEVNITRFLHKPINPSILNDLLSEVLLGQYNYERIEYQHTKQNLKHKIKTLNGSHILLVEDNEVNQELVKDLLKSSGILVDIANDGEEGISKFKKGNYELILMDIQMPILDGYEATKKIREIDKNIPIIALTANAMREDIEKTKIYGMNRHLNKPIEVDKLYQALLEFIPKKTNIQEEIIENNNKNEFILPEFKTLDKNYALNLVMGIETALIQILKGLIKYKNINVQDLNNEDFKRLMHTLKGLLASAGALEASNMAKEIEFTLNKDLVPKFSIKLNEIIEEIEEKIILEEKIEKNDITKEKADELFKELKEAVASKRAKNCKPIIKELKEYNLNEKDTKLFNEVEELTSKFKFKEALELFDE